MRKLIPLLFLIFSLSMSSQVISSGKWTDLFSYNNVLAIRQDTDRLIVATENGIFYYSPSTGEISKLSKANGLHEVKITAFDYNPETRMGLVGYKNGSMDVISPDGITYVVDIPIATGFIGDKKINHISINGNLAVISVDYGVSIFNMDRKEFGDSSFFMSNGLYQGSNEAVIFNDKVFAATKSGLKMHDFSPTFSVYSSWTKIADGDILTIDKNANTIAYGTLGKVYFGNGVSFSALAPNFAAVQDVVLTAENLIVADKTKVSVFSSDGVEVGSFEANENLNSGYYSQSEIYAGTKISGMLNENNEKLKPDGPFSNVSYKIDLQGSQLVISSGGRDSYNNPINHLFGYRNLGYYHFNGSQWVYPEIFLTSTTKFNVMDAVINPAKPEEIFFVNYTWINGGKGIYKMNNNEFVKLYQSTGEAYNRIIGVTFDENNQLFASVWSGSNTAGLMGFYAYNAANDSFKLTDVVKGLSVQKPIAKDGILYIPSPYTSGGIILYNYHNTPLVTSDDQFTILKSGNNLPADQVISATVDKHDELWIGTEKGLRVISNPAAVITETNPQAETIIIEENGIGEELFRDSNVLQIEADSGNQKWVSIDGGGIFYLSPNGEKTLAHFTRANSPLPTDNVTDIKVDQTNGKVYFVTLEGVVVYQGDAVNVTENFGEVLVYPNPVIYAQYKGNVTIRGLAAKTNIRITDAAGNLVHQAIARGGSYQWNLQNSRGKRVASGIYFVLMTNEDGTDTATAKIAVVN